MRIEVKIVKYMVQSFYKRFSSKTGFLVCCRMHANSHCLKFHNIVLINSVVLLSSCFTVYPSSFSFFLSFLVPALVLFQLFTVSQNWPIKRQWVMVALVVCFLDFLYVMGDFSLFWVGLLCNCLALLLELAWAEW